MNNARRRGLLKNFFSLQRVSSRRGGQDTARGTHPGGTSNPPHVPPVVLAEQVQNVDGGQPGQEVGQAPSILQLGEVPVDKVGDPHLQVAQGHPQEPGVGGARPPLHGLKLGRHFGSVVEEVQRGRLPAAGKPDAVRGGADAADVDARALEAFRRALEINPRHEDIRRLVDKLTLEVEGQGI